MKRPRVAVLDYQAGNLRSARRGLERAGADVVVTDDAETASRAEAVVVPGVGHFSTCLAALRRTGLADLVERQVDAGAPVLGICVGMQLLYERSEEGDTAGLGLLPGQVVRLPDTVRVPHMGWNRVEAVQSDDLLDGVGGERAYFVHSFYPRPTDPGHVVATSTYPGPFPCVVRGGPTGRVVGTQFHPEKSGDVGARLLHNWVAGLRAG